MEYELSLMLQEEGAWDTRKVRTDEEMFGVIGKFAVWYWIELESVDYQDADWSNYGEPDRSDKILAFTAHKDSDGPEGPHRHGLKNGMLGYGVCFIGGEKKDMWLEVRECSRSGKSS